VAAAPYQDTRARLRAIWHATLESAP